MKNVYSMILSLLTLGLMGWALTSMYDAYSQFADVLKIDPPWEITINLIPIFVFLVFSIILYIIYKRKKKLDQSISVWLYPLQFSERDEREREISGQACRKAFISSWISAPAVAALLVFYPLFQEQFQYFPIVVVLIIPAIQIITYYVHIRRI